MLISYKIDTAKSRTKYRKKSPNTPKNYRKKSQYNINIYKHYTNKITKGITPVDKPT